MRPGSVANTEGEEKKVRATFSIVAKSPNAYTNPRVPNVYCPLRMRIERPFVELEKFCEPKLLINERYNETMMKTVCTTLRTKVVETCASCFSKSRAEVAGIDAQIS